MSNDLDSDQKASKATSIPAVLRAIQLLSETVASLPIHIFEKKRDGSRVIAERHPLNKLLGMEPNKHMSSYTWRKILINDQLTIGTGISVIKNNGLTGKPTSLKYLPAHKVETKYNSSDDEYLFVYTPDPNKKDENEVYSEDEVLNFPWFTKDGIEWYAPIELAAEAIGVALAQQNNQYHMANNDSRSTGLLVNQGATVDQAKQAKESWQQAQTGSGVGKTAVLSGGWDYKQLTIPNDQLQFIQQREFSVTEIARIFGIPPHLLSDLSRATYSNIEHQGIEFVTYTLMGMLRNIEAELERKLLTENEKKRYFIRFNVNGLLRADAKTRAELYGKGIQSGWMMPNEARALEEMNGISGGDRAFIPMNMMPLDRVDELVDNQTSPEVIEPDEDDSNL